jgi:hypothetical protein
MNSRLQAAPAVGWSLVPARPQDRPARRRLKGHADQVTTHDLPDLRANVDQSNHETSANAMIAAYGRSWPAAGEIRYMGRNSCGRFILSRP